MLSRSRMLEDKMNVGPGQYTPVYGYGKEKSPAFRFIMCNAACGPNMTEEVKLFLVLDNTNTAQIWQSKKKATISAKK